MKKIFLFMTAMLCLASCNNQEELSLDVVGDEIALCSEVNQMSRSNNLELQSVQIVPGQMLGVYIYNASHAMNNSPWLVGEAGALANQRGKIYWDKNKDINIVAYQPYMPDEELNKGIFSVKTDQSTDKMYQESDLLLASRTASKQTAPVPLTFRHKLSKVMVRVVADDPHFLDGAEVWVCDTKISTPFNPNECNITAINPVSNIKAAVLTEEQQTAAAIVVPQTVSAGTKLIRINVGDRRFFYRLKNDAVYESGYSYLYTLHLSLDDEAIKLVSYQLVDWDEENSEAIYVDNHIEAVDLGLPSGTLWAPYNIGANDIEEAGTRYQWGMTTYTSYGAYSHPIYKDNVYYLNNIWDLLPEHDTARANWGPEWCMPSYEDVEELRTYCTKEEVQINGKTYLKVTGNNGNAIYFPTNEDGSTWYWTGSYARVRTIYANSSDAYSYLVLFFENDPIRCTTASYNEQCYVRPISVTKRTSSVN